MSKDSSWCLGAIFNYPSGKILSHVSFINNTTVTLQEPCYHDFIEDIFHFRIHLISCCFINICNRLPWFFQFHSLNIMNIAVKKNVVSAYTWLLCVFKSLSNYLNSFMYICVCIIIMLNIICWVYIIIIRDILLNFLNIIYISTSLIKFINVHFLSVSSITAMLALGVCLVTAALVPVDIFLVSVLKNNDGNFVVKISMTSIISLLWCDWSSWHH